MMMNTQELEAKIQAVQEKLNQPSTHPTEVYTRIVGYYRSVANWNPGKREEYNHRVTFDGENPKTIGKLKTGVPGVQPAELFQAQTTASAPAASYLFFWRKSCPNCPAVKSRLPELGLEGQSFNTDTDEGTQLALQWSIATVPTVIYLDADGRELRRAHNAQEL